MKRAPPLRWLIKIALVAFAWSAQTGLPFNVKFGFSTQGIRVIKGSANQRDFNSAQHVAALMLALEDIKQYDVMVGSQLGMPAGSGILNLQLLSYQGNQINNAATPNSFFDGAFGAYTIGYDVVGTVGAETSLSRCKSMTSTFSGWGINTLMVGQQDASFSHGRDYPLKARLIPSDNLISVPLVSMLKAYGWTRISVFYSTDLIGIDLRANLLRALSTTTLTGTSSSGIAILDEYQIRPDATDFAAMIKQAKDSGATIFVLLLAHNRQALLLKQGVELGLFVEGTQTVGVTVSGDEPEEGGKTIQQYLAESGQSAAEIANTLRGHMLFSFDPRVLFKTVAGKDFVARMKGTTTASGQGVTATRKPTTSRTSPKSFAPLLNAYLQSSTNVPAWPSGARWFADECKVWDEANGDFYSEAKDTGREIDPKWGLELYPQPGNPGWLYASIDGASTGSVFAVNKAAGNAQGNAPGDAPISFGDLNNAKLSDGTAVATLTCPTGTLTCPYGTNLTVADKFYFDWLSAPVCDVNNPTVAANCLHVPLWGTCLGLSQAELDAIAQDGSSGLDWRTMYVYDAMWIVYNNAIRFLTAKENFGTFVDNADFTNKLRVYFNTVIPSNIQSGRIASVPQDLPLTGAASFHAGYTEEDAFMQGDRISGFPYRLSQFFVNDAQFHAVAYFDPQNEQALTCEKTNNAVSMLSIQLACRQPVYRTAGDGYSLPLPMQPLFFVPLPESYRVAMQFFGSLALISTIVFLALLAANWNHHTIKMRQQHVLVCSLFGALLGSIKVLVGASWVISEAACNANYWLEHLCFRILSISLLFKLWRIDKIFNNSGFKRVRITEKTILINISIAVATCVLILALSSGLGGPRVDQKVDVVANQQLIMHFCGIPRSLSSGILHAVLLIFQALGLMGALLYAWRTKNVPPLVNEAHVIIPQLFGTFLVVVVAGSLLLSFDPNPMDFELTVNLCFALVILCSNLAYYIPVFQTMWLHEAKQKKGVSARGGGTQGAPAASGETTYLSTRRGSETSVGSIEQSGKSVSVSFNAEIGGGYHVSGGNGGGIGEGASSPSRRGSQFSDGVDTDALHEQLAQELLRKARSADRKAMLCQEKIVFWRSMMLKVEEAAENDSGSGGAYNTASRLTSSVAVTDHDEDDAVELARIAAEDAATGTLTGTTTLP